MYCILNYLWFSPLTFCCLFLYCYKIAGSLLMIGFSPRVFMYSSNCDGFLFPSLLWHRCRCAAPLSPSPVICGARAQFQCLIFCLFHCITITFICCWLSICFSPTSMSLTVAVLILINNNQIAPNLILTNYVNVRGCYCSPKKSPVSYCQFHQRVGAVGAYRRTDGEVHHLNRKKERKIISDCVDRE